MHLNSWLPLGGIVWGTFRRCSLVGGSMPGCGLWEFKDPCYFQFASHLWFNMWNQPPDLATTSAASCHIFAQHQVIVSLGDHRPKETFPSMSYLGLGALSQQEKSDECREERVHLAWPFSWQSIIESSQGRNLRRGLRQRSWKNTAYWLVPRTHKIVKEQNFLMKNKQTKQQQNLHFLIRKKYFILIS